MPKLHTISQNTKFKLQWTASLSSLNELIYSLKASGAINNGNVGVGQIAEAFEELFNIRVGNIYRRQQENRIRENRSAFIDLLKRKYIEIMDQTDLNPRFSTK